MVRRAGACLGLFAFCVAVLRGMAVGNPPMSILSKALWAMLFFFTLGLVLGHLANLLFDEHEMRRRSELAEIREREASENASKPEVEADDDDVIEVGAPGEIPA